MGRYLEVSDLTEFASDIPIAKAALMIDDAESLALLVAPCLNMDNEDYDLSDNSQLAVRAILRAAILRWNDSGSGAFQQQTTGPFSATIDTRQTRKGMFWPSEIESLQSICLDDTFDAVAFTIDTTPADSRNADGYWSAPDAWTPVTP
jgi:hypothetical protein